MDNEKRNQLIITLHNLENVWGFGLACGCAFTTNELKKITIKRKGDLLFWRGGDMSFFGGGGGL